MRLAVVGSRAIRDGALVSAAIEASGFAVTVVVTGGARGVDALAERWAKRRGLPVKVYRADWRRQGPAAGPIRNAEIVDDADALVAVWDGVSTGTADSIRRARERGIPVYVHRVEPTPVYEPAVEALPGFPWGVVEDGEVIAWFRDRTGADAFAALAPGRRVERFPVLPIVREAAG